MPNDTLLGNQPAAPAPNTDPAAPVAPVSDPAPPTDPAAAPAAKPAGVPDKYEFSAPEGVTLDAELTTEFEGIAKELGLPQEAAQKVHSLGAKLAAKQAAAYQAALETTQAQWKETAVKDKEFGGEKLQENLGVANKALAQFATPELKALLDGSKLGDHPEVVRLFYRLGKAMSEDKFVPGRQVPQGERSPYLSYPKSDHK